MPDSSPLVTGAVRLHKSMRTGKVLTFGDVQEAAVDEVLKAGFLEQLARALERQSNETHLRRISNVLPLRNLVFLAHLDPKISHGKSSISPLQSIDQRFLVIEVRLFSVSKEAKNDGL